MLLQGAQAFTGQCFEALDVLIEGDHIRAVAPKVDAAGAETVDLSGLVLSPGFVDVHVHLREPGFPEKETIETGTAAAAAGGFTTVCAMPNLSPAPDTAERLQAERALIDAGARVEVLPYAAITQGQQGKALADLAAMAPHCIGFSDDGKGVQSEAMMEAAMRRIADLGLLLSAHCEDEALLAPGGCVHDGAVSRRFGVSGIPSESEWRQVKRDLALVRRTRVRYHICHISTKETVALLRAAKAEGLPVSGECTPHQLALTEDDITTDDGRFKMNPPLRAEADREAIIEGLLDGTIDCIATDHAPHTAKEKARGLSGSAFGIVGLETAFAACHTALVVPGRCTLPFLLDRLTAAPARILGRSARLAEGAPANLVALDPAATWRVDPGAFHTKGRATPFAGSTLTGQVAATWYLGKRIYTGGAL